MESKVSKTFLKVIGFFASLLLTLFAGLLDYTSIACLVMSIIEGDVLTASASIAAGVAAFFCWSMRKEVLV